MESEITQSPPISREAIKQTAERDFVITAESLAKIDPRLQAELEEIDNEKKTTQRAILLEMIKNEFGCESPSRLVFGCREALMPKSEQLNFRAEIVKGTLYSLSMMESSMAILMSSRGRDEEIFRKATWSATAQWVATRTTEVLGTHVTKGRKKVGLLKQRREQSNVPDSTENDDPNDPTQPLFDKVEEVSNNIIYRAEMKVKNIRDIWPEYCRLSNQKRLNYASVVGSAVGGEYHISLAANEIPSEEKSQKTAEDVSNLINSLADSYAQIKDDAKIQGTVLGSLDKDNHVVMYEGETIPILLGKTIDGKFKTTVIDIGITNSPDRDDDTKLKINTALQGHNWHEPGYFPNAIFAVNLDTQDKLLSDKASESLMNGTSVLRPMACIAEGRVCDINGNATDKFKLELSTNHTVEDGFATDVLINGGRARWKAEDGSTVSREYSGIKGFVNKRLEESGIKITAQEQYPAQGAEFEVYLNERNDDAETVVARGLSKGELGADTLQSGIIIGNEIFIQEMRNIYGGVWDQITPFSNNTYSDKDNPFLRLIGGSITKIGVDRFDKGDTTRPFKYIMGAVSAQMFYKAERWKADNYEENKDKMEHPLPSTSEILAIMATNDLPDAVNRTILNIQASPAFFEMRNTGTYFQTIVCDTAAEDDHDHAASHSTASNDGLPGVSIRQSGRKKEFVFNASATGTLMPPEMIRVYAEFTTNFSLDYYSLMTELKERSETDNPMTLREADDRMHELYDKHGAALHELTTRATARKLKRDSARVRKEKAAA